MNLKITLLRLPARLAKAFNAWMLWINIPIYMRRKIEVRRIDVLLVVLGALCGVYYYLQSGWLGAAQGVALYVFVVLVSLWMF